MKTGPPPSLRYRILYNKTLEHRPGVLKFYVRGPRGTGFCIGGSYFFIIKELFLINKVL